MWFDSVRQTWGILLAWKLQYKLQMLQEMPNFNKIVFILMRYIPVPFGDK
ncbi:unnamed protein product [Acanthoscelides obtectus]|uniref:Uncharacterized protein n=1 Tax=Acanthoscelides obtectus TaxID=200917 RepID=A0A9P0JXG4_ACAOB|nr:unnamed protein product [Acanthoscelides obtectus]CAK1623805.1 hypothetical protein AOBTE_LOCUS2197 [Acanthoscelides obtectus]